MSTVDDFVSSLEVTLNYFVLELFFQFFIETKKSKLLVVTKK